MKVIKLTKERDITFKIIEKGNTQYIKIDDVIDLLNKIKEEEFYVVLERNEEQ